jgi:alpha-beta hydrolase superfamily lysophospholipase
MTGAKLARRSRANRFMLVAVCSVVVGLMAVAFVWWAASPSSLDAFYSFQRPKPTTAGILLRAEPVTKAVPRGTQAWRILYTTTQPDNSPAIASAVVMAALKPPDRPQPVIAWAHGLSGIAAGCAPSATSNPFASVPALDRLIAEGWAYVAPDYISLNNAEIIPLGNEAARSTLDAVRAARQIKGLNLDNLVVAWGHSQGGNAALWAGIRGVEYAPDVKLVGIAALAPASDLKGIARTMVSTTFGKIISAYLLAAYSAAYPEVKVDDYLFRNARLLTEDIDTRCAEGWPALLSEAEAKLLPSDGIFTRDPTTGPLGARLAQNTPDGPIPVPVFLAQGEADDIVLPEIQRHFVAARCAAGQVIDFKVYAARGHLSLLAPNSALEADLIGWTRDRLAGRPAPTACVDEHVAGNVQNFMKSRGSEK